jgi:glycoside/pentoside/hexuronide:cation symporter, GPH family
MNHTPETPIPSSIERMTFGTKVAYPPAVLMAIRLAIGPIPTISLIGGLILAYFYPITREKHQQILLQLAERRKSM